ncbi:MAG: helix-turn-helix transcriptional regulator [Pirellulaceae bacterium]
MSRCDDSLLTVEDIAERLKVEPATVRQWARGGLLPPPMRLTSRSLRWDRVVLTAWLRSRIGAADIQCLGGRLANGPTTSGEVPS